MQYVHYRNDGTGRDCYINNAMTIMSRSGKLSPSKEEEETLNFWSSSDRGRLGGLRTGSAGSNGSSPAESAGTGSGGGDTLTPHPPSRGGTNGSGFNLTAIMEEHFPLPSRRIYRCSGAVQAGGRPPTTHERVYESANGRQFRTGRFPTVFDAPCVKLHLPKISSAVFE